MKTSVFFVRLLMIGWLALDALPGVAKQVAHTLPTGSVRLCSIAPPVYVWLSNNDIVHLGFGLAQKPALYQFNLKTRKDRLLPESFSANPKFLKIMKINDAKLAISEKWMHWSYHRPFDFGRKAPESLEHGLPKTILVSAESNSPDHKLRLWIIKNVLTKGGSIKHGHLSSLFSLAVSSMSGANFHVIASFKPSSDATPYWPINWSPSGLYFSFVLNGSIYIAPVPKL